MDVFDAYEKGIQHLLEHLGQDHQRQAEVLTLQSRLRENIAQTRQCGDTEIRRAERAQILHELNRLAVETLKVSFNDLCDLTQPPVKHSTSTYDTVVDVTGLCSLFADQNVPEPVLLLGAGASQKSGVPLSRSLVERAAKWAYCRAHQRAPDDPTVRRSDWQPWPAALVQPSTATRGPVHVGFEPLAPIYRGASRFFP